MARAARLLVRLAVVVCALAAGVMLAALHSEYPGWSRAGMTVALESALPLAAIPWLHLGALEAAGPARARRWIAAALLADAGLLAVALPLARDGAPPLFRVLPAIAVLLGGSMLLMIAGGRWRGGESRAAERRR